jgi:hypothetical protein
MALSGGSRRKQIPSSSIFPSAVTASLLIAFANSGFKWHVWLHHTADFPDFDYKSDGMTRITACGICRKIPPESRENPLPRTAIMAGLA